MKQGQQLRTLTLFFFFLPRVLRAIYLQAASAVTAMRQRPAVLEIYRTEHTGGRSRKRRFAKLPQHFATIAPAKAGAC